MSTEGGQRLADGPGAGRAELAEGPLTDVGGHQVRSVRRGPRGPGQGRGPRQPTQPHHRRAHAGEESPLDRAELELVGGRAQHEPLDLVGVLPPDALRDHAAHGVARHDHVLEVELVDEGGHVVGAVVERELLRGDALAVPPLVEGDHAIAARQLLDRGEPGEESGAAQGVQQHDRGGAGVGSRGVGDVRRAAAGELDDVTRRNPDERQVDAVAQRPDGRTQGGADRTAPRDTGRGCRVLGAHRSAVRLGINLRGHGRT